MTEKKKHPAHDPHDGSRNTGAVPREFPPVNDPPDRTQVETALSDSKNFLQTIIETEPECVKLVASDGTLIMMNRAGLEMIQVDSLDQAKGKSIFPLIAPEYREAFRKLTEEVFQGKPGTLTFKMTGIKGRQLWLDTHAVPLRNDKDEIIALLGITRDVTEQKKVEGALLEEKKFSDAVIDSLPGLFYIIDESGNVIRWNKNFQEVFGYSPEEMTNKNALDFFREDRELVSSKIQEVFRSGSASVEATMVTKNGLSISFMLNGFRMIMNDKPYLVGVGIDISERKRLEDQLRQSQKMESIGTLAGGISHDFNNILTAIIGYGSLLQMKMRDDDPLRHHVDQILSSANRAASLTQGLLAYGRKQVLNPQRVNLNDIIMKVERFLARLIGEDVEFKCILTDKDVTVLADAGQLEQLLMNLVTNARDAMPDGGYLYIETQRIDLDEDLANAHDIRTPGTYVQLMVTDSGMGMDQKTRERIFEPFFTTKEVGRGTGLGLAMVYGIIKQHNGFVEVESEIGRGTTLKIYLPVAPREREGTPSVDLPEVTGGTETILVAEDDETVRNLITSVLTQFGYTVIQAENGEDAVKKFMANRGAIKLLLLDFMMPKKNGKETYDKIRIFEPDIKSLFLSGYAADIMGQKGLMEKGLNVIYKPILMNDLLRKVRAILDGK
ncbi:MAG: PAS domain S-box protein [Nitrospirae bacterium]|nr:PAS domain S-box protein [Nitrospirota bacterium]